MSIDQAVAFCSVQIEGQDSGEAPALHVAINTIIKLGDLEGVPQGRRARHDLLTNACTQAVVETATAVALRLDHQKIQMAEVRIRGDNEQVAAKGRSSVPLGQLGVGIQGNDHGLAQESVALAEEFGERHSQSALCLVWRGEQTERQPT